MCVRILGFLVLFFGLSGCSSLSRGTAIDPYQNISPPESLSAVYAPVLTGIPPVNVFNRMIRLPDGEIRSYGDDYYLYSRDGGLNWFQSGPMSRNNDFGVWDDQTAQFIRLKRENNRLYAVRSASIEGPWMENPVEIPGFSRPGDLIMLRLPVFVKTENGVRYLVGAHDRKSNNAYFLYSDDSGDTWTLSSPIYAPDHQPGGIHEGSRWNHGAVEPTVVQLQDGRLWALCRTAQDYHYESYSDDYGRTWSPARPSRFYGTITMPTMTRLRDGRLLFLWNNTTPLPELKRARGRWEDVFTNRDVLHAAVSEDDGQSWIGFRELYLNPNRNNPDYAREGGGKSESLDRSVHQTQVFELEEGKILVALGQHKLHRRFLIFDMDWLYEEKRTLDFSPGSGTVELSHPYVSQGLSDISSQSYLRGIKGHCAYDREEGGTLIPGEEGHYALRLERKKESRLLSENEGMVWNFPALQQGFLATRIFLESEAAGMISLTDRWFNPTDQEAWRFSMVALDIAPEDGGLTGTRGAGASLGLESGRWHELVFSWKRDQGGTLEVKLTVDDGEERTIPVLNETENGISYLHILSTAEGYSDSGILLEGAASAPETEDFRYRAP